MSIKIRSSAFTEALISAAPDTTGVFALWQNGGVIYLGKASAGSETIRKALGEQFQGRRWNDPTALTRAAGKWSRTRTSATASCCTSSRPRTAACRCGTIPQRLPT